jgi:hypothetical protein
MFEPSSLIFAVSLLIFVGFPIFAVTSLRYKHPDKIWIGITTCIINGAIGQFWLPKGLKFFFLTALLYMVFVKMLGFGLIVANLLSAGILYWRYLRLKAHPILQSKPVEVVLTKDVEDIQTLK